MNQHAHTSWIYPGPPEAHQEGAGRSPEDFTKRDTLIVKIIETGNRNGWSKSEMAKRIGLPEGTFSQWFSGKYAGRLDNQNTKVETYLDQLNDMEAVAATIPVSPPFIRTSISDEIISTLTAAQMMPAMVMIAAEAGMGKTMAGEQYKATHANTHLVTISPHTKTVHGMLVEIAETLELHQPNPAKLTRAIGRRLKRSGGGTLLIIDEAQNLVDDSINQLRHFLDVDKCGIALMGNSETYSRFAKDWSEGPKFGQLRRRFFKRVKRDKPPVTDIQAFIKACGIVEADQIKFLTGVGKKPGALGQVDMTVKLGKMLASGEGTPIKLSHLKHAWENRDVGEIQ